MNTYNFDGYRFGKIITGQGSTQHIWVSWVNEVGKKFRTRFDYRYYYYGGKFEISGARIPKKDFKRVLKTLHPIKRDHNIPQKSLI